MMAGSDCDCLICRLEQSLLDELNHEKGMKEYQRWAASSEILSPFPTVRQLLAHLHRQGNDQNFSADEVIRELVRAGASRPSRSLWQSLLLLVFIPTIHRTTSQISAAFPLLGREDTAQQLFATLLEFLDSPDLRSLRSHFAFTVARRMRRNAFRWAIRESRLDLPTDWNPILSAPQESDETREESHVGVLLVKFLDDCQRRGWLSGEERQLLTEFKLEGLTAAELAGRSARSAIAIHRRIQRLLDRLRRIARQSGSRVPEQLELFRP
jgi:DNA-directed RNA polymerase specialized sigma24 family protein